MEARFHHEKKIKKQFSNFQKSNLEPFYLKNQIYFFLVLWTFFSGFRFLCLAIFIFVFFLLWFYLWFYLWILTFFSELWLYISQFKFLFISISSLYITIRVLISELRNKETKWWGSQLSYGGYKISYINILRFLFLFPVCVCLYSSSWKCLCFLFFVRPSIVNANVFLYSLTFTAHSLSYCVFYELFVHLNDACCQSPFNSWWCSCEKFPDSLYNMNYMCLIVNMCVYCMCASFSSRWILESYLSMLYFHKIKLDWMCVCALQHLVWSMEWRSRRTSWISLVCRLAVRVRRWVLAALLSSTRHCSASSLR